jgi:hypothetical protein
MGAGPSGQGLAVLLRHDSDLEWLRREQFQLAEEARLKLRQQEESRWEEEYEMLAPPSPPGFLTRCLQGVSRAFLRRRPVRSPRPRSTPPASRQSPPAP